MANHIIVMKLIVYIYIYFIKISTHKIGNISHGPAIPSSEPQVSISSSMRPPGVGRPWPISCRCWRDFSCLGQLGNPQMKYYIWRVLMCFNRNIHGKSTINQFCGFSIAMFDCQRILGILQDGAPQL